MNLPNIFRIGFGGLMNMRQQFCGKETIRHTKENGEKKTPKNLYGQSESIKILIYNCVSVWKLSWFIVDLIFMKMLNIRKYNEENIQWPWLYGLDYDYTHITTLYTSPYTLDASMNFERFFLFVFNFIIYIRIFINLCEQ